MEIIHFSPANQRKSTTRVRRARLARQGQEVGRENTVALRFAYDIVLISVSHN